MAGHNTQTLVRMANQIASFFAPYGGEQEVAGVLNHITRFWAPTMRNDLAVYIEQGGDGLKPSILEAFRRMEAGATRDRQSPPQGRSRMATEAG